MSPLGSFLAKLFRGSRKETLSRALRAGGRIQTGVEEQEYAGAVYKVGDFIGKSYEVLGVLGVGGFSIVYLVYSHETETPYALKTLRDEYLEDHETREQFRREAKVWVDLERHPYIVSAHFIEEFAGRLYIGMEYIAPNEDGLNSLEGYLAHKTPDLAQTLRWAIQCCHGMEYANLRGIRSHRDLKPANIMITQDGTVKITDFGFADVISPMRMRDLMMRSRRLSHTPVGFGTPNYMPPEQFANASRCDARSDIYSLGIVLYQMASGGRVPFNPPVKRRFTGRRSRPNVWRDMHQMHASARVPPLKSALFPIISRCLEKEQSARYQTFKDLRLDLEALLRKQTGEVMIPDRAEGIEAWQLYNKAFSLANLGHHEEAITYYDRVLKLEPRNADAWNNKGVCCKKLGRLEDALTCYDRAIQAERHSASAWSNKGNVLYSLGRFADAIVSLNRAVDIDPLNDSAWLNRAMAEERLGLKGEAAASYQRFLDLTPEEHSERVEFAKRHLAQLRGASPASSSPR